MKNLSILFPVYNEEEVLCRSVNRLLRYLKRNKSKDIEIILVDNGSHDRTPEILERLESQSPWIRVLWLPLPSFGEAVRIGIESAERDFILLLNVDWWEVKFIEEAYAVRDTADLIVASKVLDPTLDERPIVRQYSTRLLMLVIRFLFRYRGTDTHGIKLVNRKKILPLLKVCQASELLETELLIRAQNVGLKIKELSCAIKELRPPRKPVIFRLKQILRELISLRIMLKNKSSLREPTAYHVDDFGYSQASYWKTLKLQRTGLLTGVSLMVTMPKLGETIEQQKYIRAPIFLHVDLVEGKPVSNLSAIRTLVDQQGNFYPLFHFVMRLLLKIVDPKEVENEVQAQLSLARSNGLEIVGIDTHRHTHMFSPVAEVVEKVRLQEKLISHGRYGSFVTLSLLGFSKRCLVLLASFYSRLIYYFDLSLPMSWQGTIDRSVVFLSWEKTSFEKLSQVENKLVVVHPGLGFDK